VTPTPLLFCVQRGVVEDWGCGHHSDRVTADGVSLYGCFGSFDLLVDEEVVKVLLAAGGIATPNRKMNDGYFRQINNIFNFYSSYFYPLLGYLSNASENECYISPWLDIFLKIAYAAFSF